jgi:neurotransmitter:Na+ symporter, NSS family
MSGDPESSTERWKTGWGASLAVAGSALGLGNLARFPGQVMANGGGAFRSRTFARSSCSVSPSHGSSGRWRDTVGTTGATPAWAVLGLVAGRRIGRYFGALAVLIPLTISMYYVLTGAWCLRYAWANLSGNLDLGAARGGPLAGV